jgi:hypothetical protein
VEENAITAEQIARRLAETGVPASRLAAQVGLTKQFLSDVLRGNRSLSSFRARQLLAAIDALANEEGGHGPLLDHGRSTQRRGLTRRAPGSRPPAAGRPGLGDQDG